MIVKQKCKALVFKRTSDLYWSFHYLALRSPHCKYLHPWEFRLVLKITENDARSKNKTFNSRHLAEIFYLKGYFLYLEYQENLAQPYLNFTNSLLQN